MENWKQFLKKIEKFPKKIKSEDGKILKVYFEFDKRSLENQVDKGDIEYRYCLEFEGQRYVLIEEFLFKEGETILTLENSIGRNYYITKINNSSR